MWRLTAWFAPAITVCVMVGCAPGQTGPSAAARIGADEIPLPAADPDEPVLAVFLEDHTRLDAPLLEVAAWTDGTFVWRAEPHNPDCPLSYSKSDALGFNRLFKNLAKTGVFKPDFRRSYFGPDSPFVTIEIRTASDVILLSSWHELFEDNPKLAATAHGITPLDGRTRAQLRADDPKSYRDFRDAWTAVRNALREWQSKSGDSYEGPIPTRRGSHLASP